jgi:hypothetical protein
VDVWLQWFRDNEVIVGVAATFSVVAFLATLVGVPLLLSRLPADYFISPRRSRVRNPALHAILFVGKNLLALVLLVMGVVMLVLPGPGIITTLVGISLLSFPNKRRLELRIVSNRRVARSINWIRKRAGRPPLQFPVSPRPASGPPAGG